VGHALRVVLRNTNAVEVIRELEIGTNLLCPVINGVVHGLEEDIHGIRQDVATSWDAASGIGLDECGQQELVEACVLPGVLVGDCDLLNPADVHEVFPSPCKLVPSRRGHSRGSCGSWGFETTPP